MTRERIQYSFSDSIVDHHDAAHDIQESQKMTACTSRTRSLFFLIFVSAFMAASSAAQETNRPPAMICQNSTATESSLGDALDVPLRDVTTPGSGEPLACVVCDCGAAGNVYYWGTASCASGAPTCTEIHDGVARVLPQVQAASGMAVPALSLLGAAVLGGGILTAAFFNRHRRS